VAGRSTVAAEQVAPDPGGSAGRVTMREASSERGTPPEARTPTSAGHPIDHDVALLRDARGGAAGALGDLYDRHGPALFTLAYTVTGSSAMAGSRVVDVMGVACLDPTSMDPTRSVLHELSRLTFESCRSTADGTDSRFPADRQGALLGLTVHGDHTYRETALLLGLSPLEALELIRSALTPSGRLDGPAADPAIERLEG
jgi:hypothetical protein